MDRPTNNSLLYLTKVRPHLLQRDNLIVDPYVYESLQELLGCNVVEEFGDYTRSFYTLEGHYHNLWKFDRPILPKPKIPLLDKAIDLARITFMLSSKVQSHRWDDLASVPFVPTSTAGWGYTGKKGDPGNHAIAINKAVKALNWWHEGKLGLNVPYRTSPDLAFTRTQLGTIQSPKIRHVWGASFENIILEGMSAAPLIQAYQNIGFPMPTGIHLYKRLPSIINEILYSRNEQRTGIGIDISSFDSSVQPWLIDTSFDILKENVIFPTYMEELAFEYSREHFLRRPVIMPDGRMWLKQVGVPSGSYFTQLIDSVANLIVNYYAQLEVYGRIFKTWILGDDSAFGIPLELDLNPSIHNFAPHFLRLGFTVHPDKGVVATHPSQMEFLGHTAIGTHVSREMLQTMRLAIYPEHSVDGPAISLSRVRGLMLDSGLTSWPIVQLNDYMSAKYDHLSSFEQLEYPSEDIHWMQSVVGHSIKPREINMIKSWTFT